MTADDPMAPVFRALADPSRRLLLDRLFERDGQTLGQLSAHLPEMTRFGVMRHLEVLEATGVVVARRTGREKRHYLNPVPIRLLHDRWIGKYAEPVIGAMSAMKRHLEAPMDHVDHVYSVYVQAPPERVWQAITDGDETARYYYGTRLETTLEPGAPLTYTYPDGTLAAEGRILHIEPARRFHILFDPKWDEGVAGDPPVEMDWQLEPVGQATRLTVTTIGLEPGSTSAEAFGGGVVYIVSGLKTVVETGVALAVGA